MTVEEVPRFFFFFFFLKRLLWFGRIRNGGGAVDPILPPSSGRFNSNSGKQPGSEEHSQYTRIRGRWDDGYRLLFSRFIFGEEPTKVFGVIEEDPELHTDVLSSGVLLFSVRAFRIHL